MVHYELLAKTMVITVNTWLGYPYMMILCIGLLKSIPDDLYEASAIDGATPLQNLFHITIPMIFKPLIPLMIASFAFNFNNLVLIALLTDGAPDMLNATTPAGATDILCELHLQDCFWVLRTGLRSGISDSNSDFPDGGCDCLGEPQGNPKISVTRRTVTMAMVQPRNLASRAWTARIFMWLFLLLILFPFFHDYFDFIENG